MLYFGKTILFFIVNIYRISDPLLNLFLKGVGSCLTPLCPNPNTQTFTRSRPLCMQCSPLTEPTNWGPGFTTHWQHQDIKACRGMEMETPALDSVERSASRSRRFALWNWNPVSRPCVLLTSQWRLWQNFQRRWRDLKPWSFGYFPEWAVIRHY